MPSLLLSGLANAPGPARSTSRPPSGSSHTSQALTLMRGSCVVS